MIKYYFTAGIDCSVLMPELQKINFPFYALIDSNRDETYVADIRVDVSNTFDRVIDEINKTLSRINRKPVEVNSITILNMCEHMANVMRVFGEHDHILDEYKRDYLETYANALYEESHDTEGMYEH